ncbi:hypothetical protein MKX64_09025 [Paenibacillus sp. FSL M8-0334]|uniref:hypothetical protein n=1 Tax=Paenibacillus sp. FSL M8-0334 TaxID=2921623 RepID=UPI0030FBB276
MEWSSRKSENNSDRKDDPRLSGQRAAKRRYSTSKRDPALRGRRRARLGHEPTPTQAEAEPPEAGVLRRETERRKRNRPEEAQAFAFVFGFRRWNESSRKSENNSDRKDDPRLSGERAAKRSTRSCPAEAVGKLAAEQQPEHPVAVLRGQGGAARYQRWRSIAKLEQANARPQRSGRRRARLGHESHPHPGGGRAAGGWGAAEGSRAKKAESA